MVAEKSIRETEDDFIIMLQEDMVNLKLIQFWEEESCILLKRSLPLALGLL